MSSWLRHVVIGLAIIVAGCTAPPFDVDGRYLGPLDCREGASQRLPLLRDEMLYTVVVAAP